MRTPCPCRCRRQVYRKSFRLNSTHGHGGGNVVSLVSTDCIKVYEGVQHFHNVWTAPLEAATIIGLLLWRTGGAFGLPALGVVLVVLPLQYYFGYRIAAYKMENVHVADGRVMRMHEVRALLEAALQGCKARALQQAATRAAGPCLADWLFMNHRHAWQFHGTFSPTLACRSSWLSSWSSSMCGSARLQSRWNR